MTRYVAFLRGINVGGHRVKMDHLRVLFEEMGFSEVSTFIASGNVVFSSPEGDAAALEARIADDLAERLGYEVATFIRTVPELADVALGRPFSEAETAEPDRSLYVVFLHAPPGDDLRERLEALGTDTDDLRVDGREIYWLVRGKLMDSAVFGGELDKATRDTPTTMRNANTLRRMLAKYGG